MTRIQRVCIEMGSVLRILSVRDLAMTFISSVDSELSSAALNIHQTQERTEKLYRTTLQWRSSIWNLPKRCVKGAFIDLCTPVYRSKFGVRAIRLVR